MRERPSRLDAPRTVTIVPAWYVMHREEQDIQSVCLHGFRYFSPVISQVLHDHHVNAYWSAESAGQLTVHSSCIGENEGEYGIRSYFTPHRLNSSTILASPVSKACP